MYIADESNYDLGNNYNKSPKNNKRKKKKFDLDPNIKMIIVIIIAILIGVIVYSIANSLVSSPSKKANTENNTAEEIEVSKTLDLKDKTVKKIYKYIKYHNDNIFIKNNSIKIENLSNYDKFNYVSQLIKDSDIDEIESATGEKIYSISESKINKYMKNLFGPDITFDKNITQSVLLSFDKDGKNYASIKYNKNMSCYTVSFIDKKEEEPTNNYYTEFSSAKREDNKIIIKEKVLYINLSEVDGKYNYEIYKDYNKTLLIDKKEGISKEEFNLKDIVKENKSKISTITYTFKKSNDNYYFVSSKVNIK